MSTENLANRVDELERDLKTWKGQTGFVDHHALALEELSRLQALSESGAEEAKKTLKEYLPLLAKWRKRGETAMRKLPNKNNFTDAIALERLLEQAQNSCAEIPETWKGIASSLAVDDVLEHLPSIRLRIDRANLDVLCIRNLRDGIRRFVANLEKVTTLLEK